MKKLLFLLPLFGFSVMAADVDRRSLATGNTNWMTAPRAAVYNSAAIPQPAQTVSISSIQMTDPVMTAPRANRDNEKNACMGNNIGIGNTFVWANKSSNPSNYSTMIEDLDNPENNICFVRVEMKSTDSKISMTDISGRYFALNSNIVCGSWVDEQKIEDKIVKAGKKKRTIGTVIAAVGGAGVGVGAMELFGNKLIGGKVMGQAGMEQNEKLRSQMLVMKTEDPSGYTKLQRDLRALQDLCAESNWAGHIDRRPDECDTYNFEVLLKA